MGYQDNIKILANTDMTEIQRMEQIVRDMAKTIDTIMGYKYTVEHYKGESPGILQDETNKVKNTLVILVSNIDVLDVKMEMNLKILTEKRVAKIVRKVGGKVC